MGYHWERGSPEVINLSEDSKEVGDGDRWAGRKRVSTEALALCLRLGCYRIVKVRQACLTGEVTRLQFPIPTP